MAGEWSEGVTRGNGTTGDANDSGGDEITCHHNHIPTVAEYSKAMGIYHTVLVSVAACTALLLYLLYALQVHHTLLHVHNAFRKHVLWITMSCPFMSLMAVVEVLVPRAHKVCKALKVTYLSLTLSHFMDLTIALFANEEAMLAKLSDKQINLHVGPLCCCCLCLPSPAVTKTRLRWVRWVLWQMPYTQVVYFVVEIIWTIANTDHFGRLVSNFNTVWITLLRFVTIIAGIYGLNILLALTRHALDHYGYQRKSFSLKVLVLATQLQSFFLDVLSSFSVFPCLSPYIPSKVFGQTLESGLYIPEMLLIGLYTWRTYANLQLETTTKDQEEGSNAVPALDKGSNAPTHEIQSSVPATPNTHVGSSSNAFFLPFMYPTSSFPPVLPSTFRRYSV
ncbi:organic solute transporter alpha-like protein isoform X1 [Scylla paramamosain]|uniref:organic solute transporter alpha-like protein isoform X1 n=1 Tax=Scylla paramamosain TaxID=85552 RepID=UPI0030831FBA